MHYILDTGFLVLSRDYYPDTFSSFWMELEKLIVSQNISSVDEVKEEIENYGGEQEHLLEWISKHKGIFTKPTLDEQLNVKKILHTNNFKNILGRKRILKGEPFADPFLIAKAMTVGGTVVTRERLSTTDKKGNIQGAPRIPNICQHFSVPCMSPKEFMATQGWAF